MLKASQALLFSIAALLGSWGAPAQAQDPYSLGYAYLFGYGATNTPRITSFVPAPPYFALHPPVYYGQRYMRPYGDSPFASWPQLQPAAGYHPYPAAAHAQILVNPYAPAICPGCPVDEPIGAPADPSADTPVESPVVSQAAVVRPLVIDNPYYSAADAGRLVSTADGEAATSDR